MLARPRPAAPISFASKRPPEAIGSIRIVPGARLCWEAWSRRSSSALPLTRGRRKARRTLGGPPRGSCAASWPRLPTWYSRCVPGRSRHATPQWSPRSAAARRGRQSQRRLRLHRASRTTAGPAIIPGWPAGRQPCQSRRSPQFGTAPVVPGRHVNHVPIGRLWHPSRDSGTTCHSDARAGQVGFAGTPSATAYLRYEVWHAGVVHQRGERRPGCRSGRG